MTWTGCRACELVRTILLCVILGGAAGFGVLAYGGSQDASMVATFCAAIAPILWQARRNRTRDKDQS